MADKKEIFADGIGQIHFAGNMVRFDFVTLQPEEDGKAPVPQSNVRIIMPPQGFLGAFNSMQQLIDKLVDAGILKKTEPAVESQSEVKTELKAEVKSEPKTGTKNDSKNKTKK